MIISLTWNSQSNMDSTSIVASITLVISPLAGGLNPLKNVKVSWDDEIPNVWKVIKLYKIHIPNHQPAPCYPRSWWLSPPSWSYPWYTPIFSDLLIFLPVGGSLGTSFSSHPQDSVADRWSERLGVFGLETNNHGKIVVQPWENGDLTYPTNKDTGISCRFIAELW